MPCRIAGVGSCLPDRVVTNDELGPLVSMRPARIRELFDIVERHWVRSNPGPDPAPGQRCSDLAAEAGRRALAHAGIDLAEVDTLIAVSSTPDGLVPSFDGVVAAKLAVGGAFTVGLHAACAGFFRAAALVEALIAAERTRTALVVVAEAVSPLFRFGPDVERNHRMNAALYADGAGAAVLTRDDRHGPRINAVVCRRSGDASPPGVTLHGMLSAYPPSAERLTSMDYLGHHDFHTVLDRGSKLTNHALMELTRLSGGSFDDYDLFLTHQATGRLHQIAAGFGVPPEKMPTNIDHVGNTIGASILILLDEVVRTGRVAAGNRLALFTAESSTWSYGAMDIQW